MRKGKHHSQPTFMLVHASSFIVGVTKEVHKEKLEADKAGQCCVWSTVLVIDSRDLCQ